MPPLVSRIINGIRKEYRKSGVSFEVTASVGIAHYPEDGHFFAELYHCADLALYDAKRKGKIVIRDIKTQLCEEFLGQGREILEKYYRLRDVTM